MEQLHCRSRFVVGWHGFNLALKHGNKATRHVRAFLLSAICKQYLSMGKGGNVGGQYSYVEGLAAYKAFFFFLRKPLLT